MITKIEYSIRSAETPDNNLSLMQVRISRSKSMYVVHRAVKKQLSERRQGGANCKTRSEVRGGGKKPWRQKGTGRARAGSIRSPLWKGGGVIFGPKSKNYCQKINKKEKKVALGSILFNKKNSTFATEAGLFNLDDSKTKVLIKKLEKLNIDHNEKILIIVPKKNKNALLAARNLGNIEIIAANQINSLAIIRAKYILIDKSALEIIKGICNG